MTRDIQALGFKLTPSIRRSIMRTADVDLGLHRERIAGLSVRVYDTHGGYGCAHKACRVHLRLADGPELAVLDVQEDLYTAIGSAFARLQLAMGRQLGCRTLPGRPGGFAPPAVGELAA